MFENFSFETPWLLALILIFIGSSVYFKKEIPSYYIPHLHKILPSKKKKSYLQFSLKWIMIVFAILSLSTPILTEQVENIHQEGIDIVLSLDTSGSMGLEGFNENNSSQNRWQVVKEVVESFIKERKKDRIALVIFADSSAVASPLSYDNEAPLHTIEQISIGIIGKSTALIDSIVTSISLFKNSNNPSKIIILLSDGEDTASKTPLSMALKFANNHEIKIYTISIGQSNNNMLELIAEDSGAKSFSANNKEDLLDVYKSINTLETKKEETKIKVIRHLYAYFLSVSLLAGLLLSLLLRNSETF
ncbi:VWA domain-containing protein [Sulfurimonas sp. MAG313]|nr:VWA domain-containing protein [Sulfurimonas sp. MAG313]MDF1880719.1 VWA domain-containing protein [Sulfurimonas sp. MAG313]